MVFTVAIPKPGDATYVDRSQRSEMRDLVAAINAGKAVFIYGPSKCGKTTFCRAMFGHRLIRVNCNEVTEELHFWMQVCAQLGLVVDEIWQRGMPLIPRVANIIAAQDRKILVDNLQSLTDARLRETILTRIYSLHESDVACLACTVRDDAHAIVNAVPLLHARSAVKAFPQWTVDDLEKIGDQGFKSLQVTVAQPLLRTLAQQAFNNPCLMQEYCILLQELMDRKIAVTEQVVIEQVFAKAVDGHKKSFAHEEIKGVAGALLKSTRAPATLLKIFYLVLSSQNLNGRIGMSAIRSNIKAMCLQAPTDQNIGKAIASANKEVNQKLDDLAFRMVNDEIYIVNSWFLVYLRWVVRPAFGFQSIGDPIKIN